jgi:hypothetical protein
LGALLQPVNRPEELEGKQLQVTVATVIWVGLAQAGHPEAPGPRDRKHFHNHPLVKVAVILMPVDFCPRSPVVQAFDRPALQMIIITSVDRVADWLDPDGLEVKANPLVRFVFRGEVRIGCKVGGILKAIWTRNAARYDLDDALVLDDATSKTPCGYRFEVYKSFADLRTEIISRQKDIRELILCGWNILRRFEAIGTTSLPNIQAIIAIPLSPTF